MPAPVDNLSAGLAAADPEERRQAAEQLLRLGAEARGAAVALVKACADEDEEVREHATGALEELGPPRPIDAGALIALLQHEHADVAYWSATLIGRLGNEAASGSAAVVPALIASLQEAPAAAVRQRCAWALGMIGPAANDARAALAAASTDDDPRLAKLAQDAIRSLDSAQR